MQIFTFLFKFLEELLITWGHARWQIFNKSKFRLHNWITRTKISLNANFHLFIQIARKIIDTLPILGYFEHKLILWRHWRARIFKISKCGIRNWIPHAKIRVNANFYLFIQIPRWIIDTLPIYGILCLNWSCDVTGRLEFSKFQNLDLIIEFFLLKLI